MLKLVLAFCCRAFTVTVIVTVTGVLDIHSLMDYSEMCESIKQDS
jgi:hypothetical protein